jgi:hypothetical protein
MMHGRVMIFTSYRRRSKSPSRDGQRRMLSEDIRDVEHSIEATEGNGRKATYTKSWLYRKGA